MYKIINKGVFIAVVDEPRYVKMHDNGCWVQTDEENAEGIAVLGTVYPIAETGAIRCTEAEIANEAANIAEKNAADIAYVAMMADVDIPEKEENVNE